MPFLQEYTMLDELGRGGFATVYKVRHNELGYIRAVRVLNETIVDTDSPTYQKFLRECKVLLRLGNGNHPNIVHIYQPRLLDNKALVEMDYVDGQDIFHYLRQNQNFVPVDEVVRMAMQMSSALAYCHEDIYKFCMDRNTDNLQDDPNDGSKVLVDDKTRKRLIEKYKVIHNDIHSGNIMRREDGNFVLLDFGLAINGDEVVRSSRRKNGAPEFKAPEKWGNEAILTEQSDIYSFGVLLYQCLAGRVPFPFNTRNSNSIEEEYLLSKAHQNATPPSIEEIRKDFFEKKFKGQVYKKDFPQWLEDVIMKCLQKNPADRFRNGAELYDCVSFYAKNENTRHIAVEMDYLVAASNKLEILLNDLRETIRLLNQQLNSSQDNRQTIDSKGRNEVNEGSDELSELRKAALQGDVDAQYALGKMYYKKDTVEGEDEAWKWFLKAAEHGNVEAQCLVGDWRRYGSPHAITTVSPEDALRWYRKAAEQGYAEAQYKIGVMYQKGIWVRVDYTKAVEWYRMAAKKGYAAAQCALAYMYEVGLGLDQDQDEALRWYRKAAVQGDACAQYNLGNIYYYGKGVKKNYAEALIWYRKAAEQGHLEAINILKSIRE